MAQRYSNLVQPPAWYTALPRAIYKTLPKVDVSDDWFSVYRIFPDIYAIYEDRHFQEVISYLVVGEKRSMLVDTGMGFGNMKAVIDRLCDGEVIVINTHSHFDHIGGNYQFPMNYIFDQPIAKKRLSEGLSHAMVEDNLVEDSTVLPYPEGFDPETYVIRPCVFTTIDETFTVDTGNRTFHVMHTPGHSPDSIMIYDEENKIVFTGDTYYPATLYAHLAAPDGLASVFETYRASMHKAADKFEDYTVIPSHNEPLRPGHVLRDVANAFDLIAEGKILPEKDGELNKYPFDDFAIVTR